MKKVNVVLQGIPGLPVVLLTSLLFFVMLASVAPANAETFLVGLHGQGVHAWEWPNGVSVTMTIYDAPSGNSLCTDTQTSPLGGEGFSFDLSGCLLIQPGYYVEMTAGATTKTHEVMALALTEVDTVNNTVAGTVDPYESVDLQVVSTAFPVWTTIFNEMDVVQADASGNWEFNIPVDVEAGMYVEAMWHDADNQSTRYGWGPAMNVSPAGDFVHTWGWPPVVDVTLEVYENDQAGTPFCTANATSLPNGEGFDFNLNGSCDIVPGNLVELSETSPTFYIGTLSHTVTYLTVDCVGSVDGFVRGTAEPGSGVLVHGGGEMKYVVTDGSGNWVAGPFELPLWGVRAENLGEFGGNTQVDREFTGEACSMPAIDFPFAFADRFPGNAQHLGFSKGNKLALGATIVPNGCTIELATATNGVEDYELTHTPLSFGLNNWQVVPLPLFDPTLHLGVWTITVKHNCGSDVSETTHNFDQGGVMPYVKDIQASGDPLTPTISWRPPKAKKIPDFCYTQNQYRLRLLKANNQFYRSPATTTPSVSIPEGVLTAPDIPDTWVRIEHRCIDYLDDGGLELRSETFRPLQELLNNANGF